MVWIGIKEKESFIAAMELTGSCSMAEMIGKLGRACGEALDKNPQPAGNVKVTFVK